MSEGHSTYTPKSGLGRWVDARMPLPRLVYDSFIAYPVPRNLNYAWTFGGILSIMLVAQILTGVVLAMHYVSDTVLAFNSVEKIVRDVNQGWLLRYLHANGASFFFVAVYIHIFRGLYYGSYKAPRELLWILGCIIYLLMMATGFMGYVLPWGQMSFWGATVITGFFTAIPLVGEWVQQLLLGGFAVDNPTLNRFFSLHYLLPFMIAGVVVLHVWALHVTGQTNPTGIEVKTKGDTVPFSPHASAKDGFAMVIFLLVFAYFIFYIPNFLGHPDNYTEANPLKTPAHIVPEWYDQLQARWRARHVRRDRGAVRGAVARHLQGALGGLPALVQAVLLAAGGRRDLPRLAGLAPRRGRLRRHGPDRHALLFRLLHRADAAARPDRDAEAAAQLDHRGGAREAPTQGGRRGAAGGGAGPRSLNADLGFERGF